MFFNHLYDRLDKIEESLENVSKHIERTAPMVEEYHAARIMRRKWGERLKYYTIIIGLVMAFFSIGDFVIGKILKPGQEQEKPTKSETKNHPSSSKVPLV